MELRVLKYFLVVANVGSVTKASDILHITQPTLSRQLMQLEEDLGVALFVRGKRKMLLTEEGLHLKRRAEEILSLAKKTELELNKQNKINGNISIGSGITKASSALSHVIVAFLNEYPDVTWSFKNGNTDLVLENLENGVVDIGVTLNPKNLDKYSYLQLKEKERWGLLISKESPLAKLPHITFDDLEKLSLVVSSRDDLRENFQEWSDNRFEQLQIIANYDILTQVLFLLQDHQVGAIVVEDAVKEQNLTFVPFYPEMTATSYVIWKKYQSLSLTTSKFIDYLSKNENFK